MSDAATATTSTSSTSMSGSVEEDKAAMLSMLRKLDDHTLLQVIEKVIIAHPATAPAIVAAACPDLTFVPSSALTARRAKGVVSKADAEGGMIHCEELQSAHGCQVAVDRRQLGFFKVGQEVTFAIFLSKDNKPQAFDVQTLSGLGAAGTVKMASHSSLPTSSPLAPPGLGENESLGEKVIGQFLGIIRSIDEEKGFGFITSDQLKAYGMSEDCYVHKQHLGNFVTGSEVSFTAFLDQRNGRPRAKDVKCARGKVGPQSGMQGWNPPSALGTDKGDRELGNYIGIIKSFNVEKGFGFIVCPQLKDEGWDGDVYLHQKHVLTCPFRIGEKVSFTAYVFQGRLQGRELRDPDNPGVPVTRDPEAGSIGYGLMTGDMTVPGAPEPVVVPSPMAAMAMANPMAQMGMVNPMMAMMGPMMAMMGAMGAMGAMCNDND